MVLKQMICGVVVAVGMAGVSQGAYSTGFESSDDAGYVAGSALPGVDGWQALNGTASEIAVVSSPVSSGRQAVKVERISTAGVRAGRKFEAVTAAPVIDVWLAWERNAGSTASATNFLYFGDDDVVDDADLGGSTAVQIGFSRNPDNIDNAVSYWDGGGYRYAGAAAFGAFYHFVASVDLEAQAYDLTITGPGVDVLATGVAFRGSDIDRISSVLMLSNTAQTRMWVDDLSVSGVPEPASMALLGLGGLALAGRRRRL